MAEEDNQSEQSKTEEPTERRLEQAFEEGQVAFSRELLHWTVLASSGAFLLWALPRVSLDFIQMLQNTFSYCGDPRATAATSSFYPNFLWFFFKTTLLLFIIVFLIIAVGFSQTRFNITLTQIIPKFERVSPLKGFSKIFGKQALVEFMKNLIKISVVGAVMLLALSGVNQSLMIMPTLTIGEGFNVMQSLFAKIFISALSILGLIALLDYIYQRFQHRKRLKMSKQDIKEEHKEQEGSPEIKAKLRAMRLQRMQSRIQDKVKSATVVVTNPTHYAVALAWDEATMEAPHVVAKGVDHLALHIRKLANDNKIPLVENPPLARTLYDKVDIDREIEPEHYRAVAEVIKYVMDLQKKWFK